MAEVKSVKTNATKQKPYERDNHFAKNKQAKLARHCKKHHGDVPAHAAMGAANSSMTSSRNGYKGPKRGFGNPPSTRLINQMRKKIKNMNAAGWQCPTFN